MLAPTSRVVTAVVDDLAKLRHGVWQGLACLAHQQTQEFIATFLEEAAARSRHAARSVRRCGIPCRLRARSAIEGAQYFLARRVSRVADYLGRIGRRCDRNTGPLRQLPIDDGAPVDGLAAARAQH